MFADLRAINSSALDPRYAHGNFFLSESYGNLFTC